VNRATGAVQALYQTWRITHLLGGALDARIIEIGAGLGRTAFYVRQFGIRDITIIDLPLSAVAQAYFLGRTLGPDAISLFGEHRSGIRILPPAAFLDAADQYDLVVNVDAPTEMSSQTARAYCQAIKSRADAFLSINHEANSFTVGEITASAGMRAANRAPYWLRRGYVEEVFFMRKTISSV
jgi:putative sugar O-methyltransferase